MFDCHAGTHVEQWREHGAQRHCGIDLMAQRSVEARCVAVASPLFPLHEVTGCDQVIDYRLNCPA